MLVLTDNVFVLPNNPLSDLSFFKAKHRRNRKTKNLFLSEYILLSFKEGAVQEFKLNEVSTCVV